MRYFSSTFINLLNIHNAVEECFFLADGAPEEAGQGAFNGDSICSLFVYPNIYGRFYPCMAPLTINL